MFKKLPVTAQKEKRKTNRKRRKDSLLCHNYVTFFTFTCILSESQAISLGMVVEKKEKKKKRK